MTHRKITVCGFIKCSSPKPHEKHQHDCRPEFCKKKGCYGVLVDCEHLMEEKIHGRENITKMIAYLRKIRKKTDS